MVSNGDIKWDIYHYHGISWSRMLDTIIYIYIYTHIYICYKYPGFFVQWGSPAGFTEQKKSDFR